MAGSALALAAARPTYQNPFGLGMGPHAQSDMTGGAGMSQMLNPPQAPRQAQTQNAPTQTAVIPIPSTQATTPGAAAAPTPTVNTTFDLQTDPALQISNALTGLSDQQANAQALKQRQQLLLQYGDPTLAASTLGQNDPTVQAAGQNPESALAMLQREYGQNMHDFENHLDPSLAFGGYRIGQEQQLGQAYQDALAKAAAGVDQGLGTITGDLNSAMSQNAMSRANALEQAYQNELKMILAGLGGGSGGGGGATDQTSGPDAGVYGSTQPYMIGGPGEVAPPTPLAGVDFQPALNQVRRAAIPGGRVYRS